MYYKLFDINYIYIYIEQKVAQIVCLLVAFWDEILLNCPFYTLHKNTAGKKSTQLFEERIIYIGSIGWDIVHCHVWSHDSHILGSLYAPYTAIFNNIYIYVLCAVNRNWHKFSPIPKDNFSGSMFSLFAGRSGHPKSNGLTMLNVYALFWLLVLDLGPFTMSTNPNVSSVGCKVIVCYSYLLSTYSIFLAYSYWRCHWHSKSLAYKRSLDLVNQLVFDDIQVVTGMTIRNCTISQF